MVTPKWISDYPSNTKRNINDFKAVGPETITLVNPPFRWLMFPMWGENLEGWNFVEKGTKTNWEDNSCWWNLMEFMFCELKPQWKRGSNGGLSVAQSCFWDVFGASLGGGLVWTTQKRSTCSEKIHHVGKLLTFLAEENSPIIMVPSFKTFRSKRQFPKTCTGLTGPSLVAHRTGIYSHTFSRLIFMVN